MDHYDYHHYFRNTWLMADPCPWPHITWPRDNQSKRVVAERPTPHWHNVNYIRAYGPDQVWRNPNIGYVWDRKPDILPRWF